MRFLASLAILLLVLAALVADKADGCEKPFTSTAAPEEGVESRTTGAGTTSADAGSNSTVSPRRRRDAVQNSTEADGFSDDAGAEIFSRAAAGDGVGRGIKTLMGLLTGAGLRAGALF